jgi:hypothetical protein
MIVKFTDASARSKAAFTLLDMFAVVGAILILVSIAPRILARARVKAEAVVCLNNGRQLTAAVQLYATSFNGLLLPTEDGVLGHVWLMRPEDDPRQNPHNALIDPARNLLIPYIGGKPQIFKCPADPGTTVMGGRRFPTVRSASLNHAIGTVCPGYPGAHSKPLLATHGPWLDGAFSHLRNSRFRTFGKESDFVNPAGTFVFIDEDPLSINDAQFGHPGYRETTPSLSTMRWIDFPASYHANAAGITFADGRAELKKWRSIVRPGPTLSSLVRPEQRADWKWLSKMATQPLR